MTITYGIKKSYVAFEMSMSNVIENEHYGNSYFTLMYDDI